MSVQRLWPWLTVMGLVVSRLCRAQMTDYPGPYPTVKGSTITKPSGVWGWYAGLHDPSVKGVPCYRCNTTDGIHRSPEMSDNCRKTQTGNDGTQPPNICFVDQVCSLTFGYFSFDAVPGHPGFWRSCLHGSYCRQAVANHPFTATEPLICTVGVTDSKTGAIRTHTCFCQGKNCNWYPEESVWIAVNNSKVDKSKRKPIPNIDGSLPSPNAVIATTSGGPCDLTAASGAGDASGGGSGAAGGDDSGGDGTGGSDGLKGGDGKGGVGTLTGSNGTSGNGTDADAAAQGGGISVGLIAGIIGGVPWL
ncbi:uncharacterized protein LOC129587929 isoform X2 [Paramacrobiotus metropolitanus]|uniref:uncharacterized protein LOC129587929 isoform X2 n=1 Tax=Paramacrobiotus metropolitanus TaxID=2943436 RepID=UPI0024461C54|nr:uncharacterized protein LOC129587929 isoform X2 [Paramacrobiotus metropolitanus]